MSEPNYTPTPPSSITLADLERLITSTVQASVKQAVMELPALPAPPAGYPVMKESAASTNTLGKSASFTAAPSADDHDTS